MFLILLLIQSADHECKWTGDGHTYDFSSVHKSSDNYHHNNQDTGVLYVWNVCHTTNHDSICPEDCCTPKTYTGWTRGTDSKCTAWGDYGETESFNYIDHNNLEVGVKISNRVYNSMGYTIRSMIQNVFCNEDVDYDVISAHQQDTHPPHIQLQLGSKFACRRESPLPSPTPDPTLCKTIQSNLYYDLEPLKGRYTYKTKTDYYIFQVCGEIVDVKGCDCCTHDNKATGWRENNGNCNALGDLNHHKWSPINNDTMEGIALQYSNINNLGHIVSTMTYLFMRDDAIDGEITSVEHKDSIPPHTYISFPTKYAIGQDPLNPTVWPSATPSPGPGKGLNGGWVFLIAAIVGAGAFFGGWVMNKRRGDNSDYEQI